jgi:galactonate dehydratase
LLSRWEFRELFESGGVAVVQPDVMHAGGLTEVRKIADLAELYYIPVAPHNPAGPIATLASIHLAAAIPNFRVLENMEEERGLREKICPSMPPLRKGGFDVPEAPGLGAEIDLSAIAAMARRPQPRDNRPWWG